MRTRKQTDHDAEAERLLDRIESLALSSPAANIANPRYFARMLAATVSVNHETELIALVELAAAMERIVRLQRR